MQVKKFKCRASASGQIMTNNRTKTGMGATAKTHCETWLKEQLYNSRKTFQTKHTQKGNEVEDGSIDFVADYLGLGMVLKNEEYFENEFANGTPDVILPDTIIDVKNSWDCFTFPIFDSNIPTNDYYYQLQVYMWLTGKRKAKLIYTLMDTPEHLIEREAYYWCKNNGFDELDLDIYEKFQKRLTYDETDDKLKIKVFDIAYDEAVIEAIKARVIECRTYIKELLCKLK